MMKKVDVTFQEYFPGDESLMLKGLNGKLFSHMLCCWCSA
ncbi:hypothetical protein LINPERPRIM_LOCUS27637, partial [Linum perenne]